MADELVASGAVADGPAVARLVFVDALRGVAAVAVMLFHLGGHRLAQVMWRQIPVIGWGVRWGELGVQVFFVISGFVIAYSVRHRRVDRQFTRTFLWRRALRLEPPYLVAIVAVLISNEISRGWFATPDVPTVTWGQVAAHVIYAQRLFGYGDLYPVFWTLTHEVQFYLIFILVVGLGQAFSARESNAALLQQPSSASAETYTSREMLLGMSPAWVISTFAVPAVLSGSGAFQANGLCLDTWYLFALGLLSYGVVFARVPWQLWAAVACGIVVFNWDTEQVEPAHKLMGIATSLSLIVAGRLGQLPRWGNWRPLQFFGAISYSLYLVHGIVGWRVLSVGERITGQQPLGAWLWFMLALTTATLAAWCLHVCVERPFMRRRSDRSVG
ncbi:MAG: acyltransferase [Planctomycetales bacterium]|nr:acyltransferase [Planctomycetales bacterium]